MRFLFSFLLFILVIFIGQVGHFDFKHIVYAHHNQNDEDLIDPQVFPLLQLSSLQTINAYKEAPFVSANNAILLDQSSGRILFEKKAHEKTSIASLTKVMTAIVAIEYGELDDMVETSKRAIHTSGSSIYLQKNEKMSLKDLLYGLMLRSGNDASVAIAEHIGGSVEGFVYLMNEKAAYVGLTNTHFANPHGLEEEGHFSSAHDVAKLMQYAMENDIFKKMTNTMSYQSENRTYQWNNKNKLLKTYEKFCIGGKTGFTKQAGRTLVTSSEKENFQLIAVTLNAPNDWNDHMSLYQWGFDNYVPMTLISKGLKKFLTTNDEELEGMISEDIVYPLRENEVENIKKQLIFNEEDDKTTGKLYFSIKNEPIVDVTFEVIKEERISFYEQFLTMVRKMIQVNVDD